MDNTKINEQELIERYAFLLGKHSTIEELVESYKETSEEMGCFSF